MTRILVTAALLIAPLCGQQAGLPSVSLDAAAPPAVSSGSATITGAIGGNQYWYWIVANYPIGKVNPKFPIFIARAPSTLSGGNYITVTWAATAGATSYDVLRTALNSAPTGACGCAVATAVSGTSQNDTSNTLSAYTVSSNVGTATANLTLNNRDNAVAEVYSDTAIHVPNCVGCGGGTNPTTVGVAQWNGTSWVGLGSGTAIITGTTACTTGFTGLSPAICATVVGTGITGATSGNLQCGGAICPAGHYQVSVYGAITGGTNPGPNMDIFTSYTDSSGTAQSFDYGANLSGSSGCAAAPGVGCNVPGVSSVQTNGSANIAYNVTVATGAGTSIYNLDIVLIRVR